jgi:hyperosmotically inducible protein
MKILTKGTIHLLALSGVLVSGSLGISAQQPTNQPASSDGMQAPAGDNTKMNQGDRDSNSTTAEQQKDNISDRQLTQHVRQALMQDKSLSTYAHNVKVVSQNGTVTLKGPVRSDDEKQAIEAKAAEVAGKDKVVNEITVVPEQK